MRACLPQYCAYQKSLLFKSNNSNNHLQVIYKVDDVLYRGYRPNENDIKQLRLNGINSIIDFSFEKFKDTSPITEKKLALQYGLNYYNIPLVDSSNPSDEDIHTFFNIVNTAKKNNEKIFIHCLQGKNRTGLMCEIYKLKNKLTTYDQSIYNLMKSKYPFGENPLAMQLLRKIAGA